MYFIYSFILYLFVPLVLARLLWLGSKNPDYLKRWPERFGFLPDLHLSKPLIWLHAVSVGEAQAAKPLVEQLLKKYSDYQFLITTTTPTGALTVRQLFGDRVVHFYFPYDLPFSVSRFLKQTNPRLLIVMETEIWPNLYRQCYEKKIPVALINARLSERSSIGYKRLSGLTGRTLQYAALIATQTKLDAERFLSLGANPDAVRVTGNLKFDILQPHSISEKAQVLRRFFSVNRTIWIAASTHEGEEKIVLEAFKEVLNTDGSCLLIMAPRHPERFQTVADLCEKMGFNTVKNSEKENYSTATQVYVLDVLGELPAFYATSDVSFVGGSLVASGGHNMLEPASLGVPVICGEYLFNFVDVAELLKKENALLLVSTAKELAETVNKLLGDANLRHGMGEKARKVVLENQGTINKVLLSLQEIFP